MNAMRPARNYDLTEITRLLLKMRDNCVRKAEGEAYDDPERKEKYEALEAAIDLINNPSMLQKWISVKERLPEEFVSVLAHMTDAGEFPNVREAYVVCGRFLFPALKEVHPVDYWTEMPEPPKEEV